ncbi:MAG: GNAT family N-acetyltransferase [candidate division WOR-3 bacterium]|nr:GNAT family N-acetyltransferase [candidate division WOR-3 bacterium]
MEETCHIVRSKKELSDLYPEGHIIEFLHKNLEQFRDPPHQIEAAIEYAFSETEGKGGFLVLQELEGELVGVVVMNRTGMSGYIPENILVYLATDSSKAPLGTGAKLLKRALEEAEGDVALHVEYNNSAKTLYETLGFTSKYVEMRYKKQ